jgi:lysyl-tRNA synthetase class 2
MLMTNNNSIQEVLFLPQMKPEKNIESLSEEEENILNIIKQNNPSILSDVKGKVELSNKKWDKAIKKLVEKKIIKVKKKEGSQNNTQDTDCHLNRQLSQQRWIWARRG